jgi:ribosomal protein S18 acetylase RimI-like enzyme
MEMEFTITLANPDERFHIAPLIYEAIGDIAFRLTGEKEEQKMLKKLQELIASDNNRHSYLNTFVAKLDEEIVGIIVLYDGKTGRELDRKLEKAIFEQNGVSIQIDVEAYDHEFYIDTLCIAPSKRGLGLGTKLLHFAEQEGKRRGYNILSLNVEVEKTKARALYTKLGFIEAEPWSIIDEPFIHMVKEINK